MHRHYQESNNLDLPHIKSPFIQFATTQNTMRFLTGLLFLVFSLQEILAQISDTVTKCCPVDEIYNSVEKR